MLFSGEVPKEFRRELGGLWVCNMLSDKMASGERLTFVAALPASQVLNELRLSEPWCERSLVLVPISFRSCAVLLTFSESSSPLASALISGVTFSLTAEGSREFFSNALASNELFPLVTSIPYSSIFFNFELEEEDF